MAWKEASMSKLQCMPGSRAAAEQMPGQAWPSPPTLQKVTLLEPTPQDSQAVLPLLKLARLSSFASIPLRFVHSATACGTLGQGKGGKPGNLAMNLQDIPGKPPLDSLQPQKGTTVSLSPWKCSTGRLRGQANTSEFESVAVPFMRGPETETKAFTRTSLQANRFAIMPPLETPTAMTVCSSPPNSCATLEITLLKKLRSST